MTSPPPRATRSDTHFPDTTRVRSQRCEAAITALPSHVVAVYGGSIEPSDVVPALSRHDIFFLPTFGENYGHVIAEALEAGLRLLISDQTPWRGLAEAGVGHEDRKSTRLNSSH